MTSRNIQRKHPEGGFEPHLTSKDANEDLQNLGAHFEVNSADLIIRKEEGEVVISDKFVSKKPLQESRKSREEVVEHTFKAFQALKKINALQRPGAHKFNIPETVRIERDKNGEPSLLVSTVMGPNIELIDLKYFSQYAFDKQSSELIRDGVLNDIELAERYNIVLAGDPYSLDTWTLVINHATGERKIMLLDTEYKVDLDPNEYSWNDQGHVYDALENIRVNKKITRPKFIGGEPKRI